MTLTWGGVRPSTYGTTGGDAAQALRRCPDTKTHASSARPRHAAGSSPTIVTHSRIGVPLPASNGSPGRGRPAIWQGLIVALDPGDKAVPLHRAARMEDALHGALGPRLEQRGWTVTIIPFAGYGAPGWVRVMARVVLARPDPRRRPRKIRAWR